MNTTRRSFELATSMVLLAFVLSAPAMAQQYGHLRGTVTDEQGTALPGVSVTLVGMGAPRVMVTDGRGELVEHPA